MKCVHSAAWALLAILVALGITSTFKSAFAQRPKVTKQQDHYSPVLAEVTMPDGEVRQVMVTGAAWVGSFNLRAHDYSHVFIGYNQVGRVTLWLDTIAEFKDTLAGEATIGLKDGTEQTLSYGDASGEGNNVLIAARADGGSEVVFLGSVKKVKFLKPARKDKQGNAMFDHWRYSPFTGEKLPED